MYQKKGLSRLRKPKNHISKFWDVIFVIIRFKGDIHSFVDAVRKHCGVESNLYALLEIVFRKDGNKTLEKMN